ncbi:MAG: hypothetical protein ACT4TC_16875 [Myxococcaceae bacterium]
MIPSTLLLLALSVTNWDATFPPAALATHLDGRTQKAIVIAAGEPTDEARSAASALQKALTKTVGVKLAMGDEAVKKSVADSDEQLIDNAKQLPADTFFVVRVFANDAEKTSTVVVTAYDKNKKLLFAFSTEPTTPLAAKEGTQAAEGVSRSAMESVYRLDPVRTADGKLSPYEEEKLEVEEGVLVSVNSGNVVGGWSRIVQGKYRRQVEIEDFFSIVGRDDLRDFYVGRSRLKTALTVAGIIATCAGGAMTVYGMVQPCQRQDANTFACLQRDKSLLYGGLGLGAAGLVSWIVGLSLNRNPVTLSEARKLADDHNRKLSRDIVSQAKSPTPRFRIAAAPTAGGAFFQFGGEL